MVTFEIGSGIKKTSWCSAEIICGGDCPQFTDSGAGVTIYHLYNVSGCNYISESSLVINIKHKDNTEWEHWVTYTMGDYEGFAYTSIIINDAINYEFKATYKGMTKYYSIVAPCIPDWQCELPLNGYEEDGCGNRRENIDCICVPNWQCRQPQDGHETDTNNCGEPDRYNEDCMECIGTDLLPCFPSPGSETAINKPGYYKGYFCKFCPGSGSGFDYVPPANWVVQSCTLMPGLGSHGCCADCVVILVELEYVDPCRGIVCENYCDGTTKYYNGKCVDGECVYDVIENSEECGFVDPCKDVLPDWICQKVDGENTGWKIDNNECYDSVYDAVSCPLSNNDEPNDGISKLVIPIGIGIGLLSMIKE